MESDIKEWIYLVSITGNFEELYKYYFSALGHIAPVFRQTGVGLLYSLGLAWAGFCFLKAPVDRLLTGLGVMVMIIVAGFLLSPTTNNKHLSDNSEGIHELSIGGYYAFLLTGTLVRVFDAGIYSSFTSTVQNANGGQGTVSDAIAIAYGTAAEEAGKMFNGLEGSEAFVDYQVTCGATALRTFTSEQQRKDLMKVGIGSNVLGIGDWERTRYKQYLNGIIEEGLIDAAVKHGLWDAMKASTVGIMDYWTEGPEDGLKLLRAIPASENLIDGSKGYRIPTENNYKTSLSGDPDSDPDATSEYEVLSDSNSKLESLHAVGAISTKVGTPEDAVFYPKNCEDLYYVAFKTMENFKKAVVDMPEYKGLQKAQLHATLEAAQSVRIATTDRMNELLKSQGIDHQVDISYMETFSDHIWDATSSVSKAIDKWMLEFKIPGVIAAMALLIVVLVVTFPIFALLSVVFGASVLWTYLKLMALPFLVVFINRFLLTSATALIMYNKQFVAISNMSNPGTVHSGAAFAAMNSETVIYLLICACEIVIVMLLLWDDVRGATRFNLGSATSSAALRGGQVAMVVGAFAKKSYSSIRRSQSEAGKKVATQKQLNSLNSIRDHVSSINQQFMSRMSATKTTGNSNVNTSLTQNRPAVYAGQGGNPPASNGSSHAASVAPQKSSRPTPSKSSNSGNGSSKP